MATTITPPTDELNLIIRGDLDILNAYDASNGTGTLHVRSGGLYVEGLTDLDQTTITTTDGKFHVLGSEKVEFNISGGAASSIEMTAEDASFFTTTAGTLLFSAAAADANGKITIQAAGTGPDSILINSTNATDGQISIQSAGGDTATDAIKILASDTTSGNILLQANGDFATSVPAIRLFADNAVSGQILLESDGGATTSDAIKLIANDTTDGNILLQAKGDFTASNPAIKLLADNTVSGQILLESASEAVGSDSIRLFATGVTGGNVAIVGAGSTSPAVLVDATSSSGQVLLRSSGDDTVINSIELLASATTDGNILIQGNGTNTNNPAIKLFADNDTSGQIVLEADGNIADAIRITADNATSGGIDIDATGLIAIDTTSTASGITIGTNTAGVPITIGTSTSLTTISGDLIVQGTTTTINTETLTVEDNIILLNSGNGELGIDSGLVIRRFQTPNDAGTGDVITSPAPIQESGAFQTGSATPGTLVLGLHASDTDDFYNGWWIIVTSGTGIDQVRRIKDYVGGTKTATLYVTADNTASFADGLDLVTAPAAADTYSLYSDAFSASFYDESADTWTFANASLIPDPVSAAGISTAIVQQYQQIRTGSIEVVPQIYRNVSGSATGTSITFTLLSHGVVVTDLIGITDSADFSPAITPGTYAVQTVPDANTFTITVAASTTSSAASSATITLFHTSRIAVNLIEPHDPGFGSINIPGISCSEDIIIPKTSTDYFFINNCSDTYGAVMMLISDLNNTDGSSGVFIAARSTAADSGTISRLASARGADNQRIDADWVDGEKIKIRHKPAGIGAGDYTYRVRLYFALS